MNTIEKLKLERPEIAVKVSWLPDPDYEWDGFGPDPVGEGLFPHGVKVSAVIDHKGELLEGTDYLGGCYSPEGGPHCPEVHGYLDQMIEAAVSELDSLLKEKIQ